MHRTTIMLPDDLRERLSEAAHRRGISAGELIRKALWRELASGESNAFLEDSRVAEAPAPANAAEKHDDYLYGEKP